MTDPEHRRQIFATHGWQASGRGDGDAEATWTQWADRLRQAPDLSQTQVRTIISQRKRVTGATAVGSAVTSYNPAFVNHVMEGTLRGDLVEVSAPVVLTDDDGRPRSIMFGVLVLVEGEDVRMIGVRQRDAVGEGPFVLPPTD